MNLLKIGELLASNVPTPDDKNEIVFLGGSWVEQDQTLEGVSLAAGFKKCTNAAVGGGGLLAGTTFLTQWNSISDKSKVTHVIICLSTNDYTNHYPIGEWNSSTIATDNTVCGKLFMLHRAINDYNPFIKTALFGALPILSHDTSRFPSGEYQGGADEMNGFFRQYTEIPLKTWENLHCPFLDQWMVLNTAWRWREYFCQSDELHWKQIAYERLKNSRIDFLRRI